MIIIIFKWNVYHIIVFLQIVVEFSMSYYISNSFFPLFSSKTVYYHYNYYINLENNNLKWNTYDRIISFWKLALK